MAFREGPRQEQSDELLPPEPINLVEAEKLKEEFKKRGTTPETPPVVSKSRPWDSLPPEELEKRKKETEQAEQKEKPAEPIIVEKQKADILEAIKEKTKGWNPLVKKIFKNKVFLGIIVSAALLTPFMRSENGPEKPETKPAATSSVPEIEPAIEKATEPLPEKPLKDVRAEKEKKTEMAIPPEDDDLDEAEKIVKEAGKKIKKAEKEKEVDKEVEKEDIKTEKEKETNILNLFKYFFEGSTSVSIGDGSFIVDIPKTGCYLVDKNALDRLGQIQAGYTQREMAFLSADQNLAKSLIKKNPSKTKAVREGQKTSAERIMSTQKRLAVRDMLEIIKECREVTEDEMPSKIKKARGIKTVENINESSGTEF